MSLDDVTETDQTKFNTNTSMPTQSYKAIPVGHVSIAGSSSACIPRLNLSRIDECNEGHVGIAGSSSACIPRLNLSRIDECNEGCEQEVVAKQRLRVDQFLTVILQVCFNTKFIILYISFY